MPEELGAFADAARARERQLTQRLAASVKVDQDFQAVLRGAVQCNLQSRQRLDALESEIRQTAAAWAALDTPAGARQFQAYLTGKTREIHKVVADAAADSQQRAGQVQALTGRYSLGGAKRGGPGDREPVNEYEQALRDAGLLDGPSPGGKYKQWLENAESRGVPPEEIVAIAREQHITPDSFKVLEGMEEIKDSEGKSFFLIPKGTSPADMRKATLMTYVLNAGTDYGAAPGTKDFKETPYSAAEVQRIANRQNANDGSYVNAWAMNHTGGRFVATPNGMLMGLGGSWVADKFSQQGGTTYGDIFMVNIDHSADPAQQLRQIAGSGHSWYDVGGQPYEDRHLDLDRILHHEERHSQQWARLGTERMGVAYLAEAARVKVFGGTNWFEKDAGLRDGGYE